MGWVDLEVLGCDQRASTEDFFSAPSSTGGRGDPVSLLQPSIWLCQYIVCPGPRGDFGSLHGGLGEEGIIFRLRVLELRVLPLMDPLIKYSLVPSCSSLPAHLGFSKTLYQRIALVFCEDGAN